MSNTYPAAAGGRRLNSNLMTRAEIARAAGVAEQAVSNWARRHPDFPQLVQIGRRVGHPVASVAAWLDGRKIHKDDLRPDEPKGRTYGHRFRQAVGLPMAPDLARRPDTMGLDELEEQLWASLSVHGRGSDDLDAYQAVVMALLCLRGTDPVGLAAIATATPETIHSITTAVRHGQPEHVSIASDVLREIPINAWWGYRLVQVAKVLTNQVSTGTDTQTAGLANRLSAASAFQYLLDRFAQARHHSPDEFLTPAELAQLMVQIADPRPADRIHNPCCSSGELLVALIDHLRSKGATKPWSRISGHAISQRTWRLASMNIALHDAPLDLGNGPPENPREIDLGPARCDVILMNPPFNMTGWQLSPQGRQRPWPCGEPPEHNSNFAWLQLALETLNPGGRAVVVMPSNAAATRNPRERTIRNAMIDGGAVRSVIVLPSHLFRETTSAVTLWVLGHPDDEARNDVLLVDARAAARFAEPTHRVLTAVGCEAIVDVFRHWLTHASDVPVAVNNVTAAAVTIDQIQEHGYDLDPATYLHRYTVDAPEDRSATSMIALRDDLDRLNTAAKLADLALDQHLDRLKAWTR